MLQVLLTFLFFAGVFHPARAVKINDDGAISYQSQPPTGDNIARWQAGWPTNGVTGWDYVGQIGGTSAVYLGDGWVLTAAHVGMGPFVLDGTSYPPIAKSAKPIEDSNGSVDLLLFQISPAPSLPPLLMSAAPPTYGDYVVMIGYGGDHGKTWGRNKISHTDAGVRSGDNKTIDFFTSPTDHNKASLVTGDSGGGAFIYNATIGRWELAGINHAISPANDSCFVQLSAYAWQINAIRFAWWSKLLQSLLLATIVLLFAAILWQIARIKRPRSR